jgi:hypothetical protein
MEFTKVAMIHKGQDGAVWGGVLFRFDADGNKKDRSDFTAVPAALSERWNLPRPKKHAPGMFLTSRCSADLSIP